MSDQVENPGGDESIEDAIDALLDEVDAECTEFEEKTTQADAQAEGEASGSAAVGDDGKPIRDGAPPTADAASQAEEAIERADEKLDELEMAADELVASVAEQASEVTGESEAGAGEGAASEEQRVDAPLSEERVSEEPVSEDTVAAEAEPEADESELDAAVDRMLGELGVENPEGGAAPTAAPPNDADSRPEVTEAADEAPGDEEDMPESAESGSGETGSAESEDPESDAIASESPEADADATSEEPAEPADGEEDGDDVLAAAVSFLADEGSEEADPADEPETAEEDALHGAAGELLEGGPVESVESELEGVEAGAEVAVAEVADDTGTETAVEAGADSEEALRKPEAPTAVTDPSAPACFDALLDGAFEDAEGEIDSRVDSEAVAAEAAQVGPTLAVDEPEPTAQPVQDSPRRAPKAEVATESLPADAGRFARYIAWARPRAIDLARRGLEASGPLGAKLVVLLSKPLDGKPPKIRDSIGWVALWTMFLAVCVWGYLVVRAPVKPVPDGNGSKVVATETATQD